MKNILFLVGLSLFAMCSVAGEEKVRDWVDKVFANPNYPIKYDTVSKNLDYLSHEHTPSLVKNSGATEFGVELEGHASIWTFVSSEHPAYPALKKKTVFMKEGLPLIEIEILCDQPSQACEDLKLSAKEELFEHYSKFTK